MRKSKRLNLNQKRLLLGMLLGDGTITNHPDFKIDHSTNQLEYLKWKEKMLNDNNITNTGIKKYKSSSGFNKNEDVYRLRIKTENMIKAIRRYTYNPEKNITNRWLKWLTPREIAIWYMDDGSINVNTSKLRSSIKHTTLIATCVNKITAQLIADYFLNKWNIKFRVFPELGKKKITYSIATCSEEDCRKFNNLIYDYIKQVPSLLYKIRNNYTKEQFKKLQESSEVRDLLFL